jgi:streptogramin lyase
MGFPKKHRLVKTLFAGIAALMIAMATVLSGGQTEISMAEPPVQSIASPALLEALESPPGLEEVGKLEGEAQPPSPKEEAELLESQQAFRGLDSAEAAEAAKQAFPEIVEEPAYQSLELAQGEQVETYPAPNVAQLDLPGDQHGVAESTLPLITKTPSGQESPVDLGLSQSEGAIEPVNPLMPVQIPLQLSEGISLPESGLTLTPVDSEEHPLGVSQGTIEGATAFYANTQTDTDTIAKPLPSGFETQTLLRSPSSPQKLYFRLASQGEPQLTKAADESITVDEEGKILATIPPPIAIDAAGTSVPVSTDIEGSQLVLTVDHRSGEYQYPIAVDPTVSEKNWGYFEQGPWVFSTNSPHNFVEPFTAGHPSFPEIYTPFSYGYGVYGAWNYHTQGTSRIYSYEPSVWSAYTEDQMTNLVGIINTGGGWEPQQYLGTYVYPQQAFLQCPVAGCPSTGGTAGNTAVYEKIAINSGPFADSVFQNLNVKIAQDTGPSATFDTTDKEIEGHLNPLYGSGVWLTSANEGRLKATGTDPGIGIYKRSLISTNYSGWSGKLTFGSATGCVGIQCLETYQMPANVANLPEGVNTIEAKVENATGAIGTKTAQVKIDNTAPFAEVLGLPNNYTISRGSIHKLEFVLSDGKAPTASSGIASGKSEVQIDGEVVLGKSGAPGCTPGPCQATRTYELHSRNEGSGIHTIKVTAEDGVGNNVVTEVPFLIKPGPSTEMGPGTLDLASGAYSLTSTDASPSSVGRGLSLTRSYSSQALPVTGSPFGPNWQMSLGGWQGVERLTDGTSIFTDARGRSMLFKPKEGGGYVTPSGYQGWSLTYDPGAAYSSSFGSEGGGNGQLLEPADIARDSKGNLWVVDKFMYFGRVQEFNASGEYIRQFGTYGSGNGQFNEPSGIAVDTKGNVWVADTGNNRIQEFNEKGEYLTKVGVSGSGNGQFNLPTGVDVDTKGNVWVADTGNNRIQKFNEKGEYLVQAGTLGSGNGQLNAPATLAVDFKGNVWVADTNNNRIQEFNEKLEYVRKVGTLGSGNGQMNHPRGIAIDTKGNAWVSDSSNGRVQQFNEKAEYVGKFGSSGTASGQFNVARGLATDSRSGRSQGEASRQPATN